MKTFGSLWKERMKKGEFILGAHIFLPNTSVAEAMAFYGYEYIWVDGEHGLYDKEEIYNHIVAINGAGAGAIVRVVAGEPFFIKPVLEMGPDGIIFPMICNAEDAKRAINACVYPPAGQRGYGPRRASRYGKINDREYLDSIDDCLVKIVQIEHIDGVNNLDYILDVKGVDAVVVGPNDLAGSLGQLGTVKSPESLACCERIIACCKARNVPCGVSTGYGDSEYLKFWLDRGANFMFAGDDIGFIKSGAEALIAKIKDMKK